MGVCGGVLSLASPKHSTTITIMQSVKHTKYTKHAICVRRNHQPMAWNAVQRIKHNGCTGTHQHASARISRLWVSRTEGRLQPAPQAMRKAWL